MSQVVDKENSSGTFWGLLLDAWQDGYVLLLK